jgi:hypothetical protein
MAKKKENKALNVLNFIISSLDKLESIIDDNFERKQFEEVLLDLLKEDKQDASIHILRGVLNDVITIKSSTPRSSRKYVRELPKTNPTELFRLQRLILQATRRGEARTIFAIQFIPVRYTVTTKTLPDDIFETQQNVYNFIKEHEVLNMPKDMDDLFKASPSLYLDKTITKYDIVTALSRLLLNGFIDYEFL